MRPSTDILTMLRWAATQVLPSPDGQWVSARRWVSTISGTLGNGPARRACLVVVTAAANSLRMTGRASTKSASGGSYKTRGTPFCLQRDAKSEWRASTSTTPATSSG